MLGQYMTHSKLYKSEIIENPHDPLTKSLVDTSCLLLLLLMSLPFHKH